MGTYLQYSKKHYLNTNLNSFCLLGSNNIDLDKLDGGLFKFFVLETTLGKDCSRYALSRDDYGINNQNTEMFLKKMCSVLNLNNNFYPFGSFSQSKNNDKDDLRCFMNTSKCFLFLFVNSSIVDSFFVSLRDSLAHGNFFRYKNGYLFFSSKKNDNYETKLKFILSIDNIERLFQLKELLIGFKDTQM